MGSRGWGGGRTKVGQEVILNVYDLNEANDYLQPAGLGFYHSGVQVGSSEYTFAGGSGIFSHSPREAPGARFRCSISMGVVESQAVVDDAVSTLRPDFGPNAYNLLTKNCNTFSDEFCLAILSKHIPAWVNRLAYMGSWFSCLVPPQMLGEAPVNGDSSGGSGSGFQVMAPGNRSVGAGGASPSFNAFGGAGASLGSTTSKSAATASHSDADGNLRDRVRQARLAALQRNESAE